MRNLNKKYSQDKKSLFKKSKKFYISLGFLLVIVAGLIFFKSGIFSLKEIEINKGKADCLTSNDIKNNLKISGNNFFLYDFKKESENLKKKYYCIKNISLNKKFPNSATVEVKERTGVAIINLITKELEKREILEGTPSSTSAVILMDFSLPKIEVGEKYLVDDEGVIFSKNITNLNIPTIYLIDTETKYNLGTSLNLVISDTLKALDKIKSWQINGKETKIFYKKILVVETDQRIIFNLEKDINEQIASLQLIFQKAKMNSKDISSGSKKPKVMRSIDLRFDKPIITFSP